MDGKKILKTIWKEIKTMTQYIDKAVIVMVIEKLIAKYKEISVGVDKKGNDWVDSVSMLNAKIDTLQSLLSTIYSLEVKEVDLNDEYIEEIYSHVDAIRDTADRMTSGNFMHHRAAIKFSANVIGQVLGLIGLKRQKGE